MTVEERLQAALRAEADTVRASDDSWSTIERRIAAARRRRIAQTSGLSVLVVAATVALVFGLIAVVDRDDGRQRVRVGGDPETTLSPSTTASPSTTVLGATASPAVWNKTFTDPLVAATAFAREYLGMPVPQVEAGDGDAQYLVRAKPGRGPITVVQTYLSAGRWVITGASSDNLQLESPATAAAISSPVSLSGESVAFEAHVNVEVRQDDQTAGRSLASTYYTGGGGSGPLEPFHTTVSFKPSERATGAVILFTRSAEDGSVSEATVVRVRFR